MVVPPGPTAIMTGRDTPCQRVQAGTAVDVTDILHATGRNGSIQNPRPQYFVYWTPITAPAATFTVQVAQASDHPGFPLYAANHPTLHQPGCAGDARITNVTRSAATISFTVRSATVGSVYWLAVKYGTASVAGQRPAAGPVATRFATAVDGLSRPETVDTIRLRRR
jgi:hypothetical protein